MDAILNYFLQNHDNILYALAGLSLVFELTIIGLSGPLLFFAIACGLTGLLVSFDLLSSWELEVLSVGILSLFTAITLWKPLKKFQGPAKVRDTSSDMIGQIVPVSAKVTKDDGTIRHSGINWQAKLEKASSLEALEEGSKAEIIAVSGNVMIVKEL